MLPASFFEQDPLTCARSLIGTTFTWNGSTGIVVETEAYSSSGDEACHTFNRPSARRFIEAHPAGTAYIYLNYGVHWMTNILVKHGPVCGFVLLRALHPVRGLPGMRRRRGRQNPTHLCSGPGKLSQALGIEGSHHGLSLVCSPDHAFHPPGPGEPTPPIISGPRIGISKAVDLPWRFGWQGSPHLSAPFRKESPQDQA